MKLLYILITGSCYIYLFRYRFRDVELIDFLFAVFSAVGFFCFTDYLGSLVWQ